MAVFKILIRSANGDISKQNLRGNTPVHLAFEQGHKRLVKWLMAIPEALAVLEMKNYAGRKPSEMSARAKHSMDRVEHQMSRTAARAAMTAVAEVRAKNKAVFQLLRAMAEAREAGPTTTDEAPAVKAAAPVVDAGPNAALLAALGRGDAAAVRAALRQGGDPNAADPHSGWRALHLAAQLQRPDLFKLLLRAGADVAAGGVRSPAQAQSTAVHLCFQLNCEPVIQLLLGLSGVQREALLRVLAQPDAAGRLPADLTSLAKHRNLGRPKAAAPAAVVLPDAVPGDIGALDVAMLQMEQGWEGLAGAEVALQSELGAGSFHQLGRGELTEADFASLGVLGEIKRQLDSEREMKRKQGTLMQSRAGQLHSQKLHLTKLPPIATSPKQASRRSKARAGAYLA